MHKNQNPKEQKDVQDEIRCRSDPRCFDVRRGIRPRRKRRLQERGCGSGIRRRREDYEPERDPTKRNQRCGRSGNLSPLFNDHNGVELNYGYSHNTQNYVGLGGVDSRSHEVSVAYVLRFPMRRWTPFVLAGAGGLVFQPNNVSLADTQARAAGVYGGGADINLSRHVFVRAEYRGLIYNSPTFGLMALSGADRITHRAEPSIGFGYRF
jgi:hypothetical protein